jgi:hypothetical protein
MYTPLRHLDFRPHGDHLLTSSAAFWLFSARVLVFAMATAEAVAWGYLGFILSDGLLRWFSASFIGITIFLVVWMIDVSLITMDRAWPEHARTILGRPMESNRRIRDGMTFALRIGLLLGSLTITAPYLAQLVFYQDIQQFNQSLAATRIDSARTQLEQRFAQADAEKARALDAARVAYEREIAGQGPSGRYGDGPTARAMQRTINALTAERAGLAHQRQREISQFDSLTHDPELNRGELATRYNLVIPTQTILGNNAVLKELRKRPEHQQTELAIKAFLLFIFAGLLLLKLFEPYSVRLYFSEVLQQEYDRYRTGAFDEVLPEVERSTARGNAMSPQRLYAFLSNVWSPARLLEENQAESKARMAAAVNALDSVQRMRDAAIQDLHQKKVEVERLTRAREEAELASTQLDSAIRTVSADVENLAQRLKELALRPDTLDELSWLEHRTTSTRKLMEARRALRELEEMVPAERYRKERCETELTEATRGLRDSAKELEVVEKQLRELRELLANSSTARARAILKAV